MSSNTNIGNTPVNQGYVQLIHTGETGGIDGTLRTLYDGDGTASDLQIASNKVKVSTELYIGSKTATEFIQDIVGDMFTTGSYTNITTTYDDTNGNIDLSASGEVTLTGTQTLTNKTLASPTFTGTANGVNLTLSGDLQVNGTTTTLDTTNLKVTDNLIELNQGVSSNANDSGIIIERGSTGDNAIIMWDESADKFTLGTTTATADATGNITITTGTLVASTFEGNLTGNVTGSASLNLLISNNLSDLANAATARTNLGVDPAGTDNSTNVTLAGTLDYITLSGQQITRNAIDLTTDVTGTLPVGNGGTGLTSISTLLNSNVTPTSLGLVIGTDVQAQDTLLQDIADFSLSNPSQDGYLIAYSDTEPQLELVAPGISFNGSTANGLLTYNSASVASVESNLTFDGSTLALTGDLNVGSGDFFVDDSTGRTGIGLTSADKKLEVSGDIKISGGDYNGLFFENAAGTTNALLYQHTANAALIIKDIVNNADRVWFGYDGDVGIGINPSEKLTIKANGDTSQEVIKIRNSSQTEILSLGIDGSGDGYLNFNSSPAVINTNGGHLALTPGGSGNVGIGTVSPAQKLDVNGRIRATSLEISDGNAIMYRNSGDFELITYGGYDINLMPSGNVGIGTNSPGSKLHIRNDSAADQLRLGRVDDDSYLSVGAGANNAVYNMVTGGTIAHQFQEDGDAKMTILTNGNVGIGVTSPGEKLEVNGNVRISGGNSLNIQGGTYSIINLLGTAETFVEKDAGTHFYIANNVSNQNIYFRVNDGGVQTIPLAINGTSSNVGIGTNSPLEKLQVAATATNSIKNALHLSNNLTDTTNAVGNGVAVTMGKDDGSYSAKIATVYEGNNPSYLQPALAFYTMHNTYLAGSETEKMRITSAGNVGIGTASPDANLVVASSSGATIKLQDTGSHAFSLVCENNSNFLNFKEGGGTSILSIDGSNQRVGIGTASPAQKLHVVGNGYFTADVVAYYSSDKRLKDNIKTIKNAVDKVSKIRGVEFDWNDKQGTYQGHDIGVVAQEVEKVLPEITTTRDDGYKAVKYEKIVPLLIEAIKEQQEQINELKEKLNG